jgi:GxxExxY protein
MATKNIQKLLYKKDCYEIAGVLFEVYNKIGYGYREKYYHYAIANELDTKNISYKRELYVPLIYKDKKVGKYYIDFLISGKIALEIKVADRFYKLHANQLLSYLHAKNIRLGILALITPEGIKYKRYIH